MITNLNNNSLDTKPFLKWAGGKKQLLTKIKKYVPANYSTYYEPFVSGGAVFLELAEKKQCKDEISYCLTSEGKNILSKAFKEKYLNIVKSILQHEIFNNALKERLRKNVNLIVMKL